MPVPDPGIPREWVDAARDAIEGNARRPRRCRFWELSGGGLMRCGECGCRMFTNTTVPQRRGVTTTITTAARSATATAAQHACTHATHHQAQTVEGAVWELVCALLEDPERLRAGLEGTDTTENAPARTGTLSGRDQHLAREARGGRAGTARLPAACCQGSYERRDDLAEALAELSETRATRREGVESHTGPQGSARRAERDRDVLLESYAGMMT